MSFRQRLDTTPAQLGDLCVAFLLTGIALVGFRAGFEGSAYLVVGLSAAVIGTASGWLVAKLRSAWAGASVAALVVFVLVGQGLATRGLAIHGVIPTLPALAGLVDGVVHGWVRLVTALPRAGSEDNLLSVPYVSGFATAMASALLALRSKRPWCVLPPLLLVAATVLVGTSRPAALLLQGAVLSVLMLGWMSWRQQRDEPTVREGLRRRVRRAAALLVLAGGVGALLGPALPFAQAQERVVLRRHVTPPLDPREVPSPLGRFRSWLLPPLHDQTLAVLDDWPAGGRLRVAAMDSYDGLAWSFGGSTDSSEAFQRVGADWPVVVRPPLRQLRVQVAQDAFRPFLPTAGVPRGVRPLGSDAASVASRLRVSLATGTVVLQQPATTERYAVVAADPPQLSLVQQSQATFDPRAVVGPVVPLGNDLTAQLDADVADAKSAFAKADALAKMFRERGYYSDGGPDTQVAPGHNLFRMLEMLRHPDRAVGDGEQFASLMALSARAMGMPSRVVLGFRPAGAGHVLVKGSDVVAWTEIAFDGIGWVSFDPVPSKDHAQVPKKLEDPRPQAVKPQIPPLVPPRADLAADEANQSAITAPRPKQKVVYGRPLYVKVAVTASLALAGLALVTSPLWGLVAWKLRRLRRRRSAGSAAQRITAGWQELLDLARDTGHSLPRRSTRAEVAAMLGQPQLVHLAGEADRAAFAPDPPDDRAAVSFWDGVDQARKAALSELGRSGKVRTWLSLRSVTPTS